MSESTMIPAIVSVSAEELAAVLQKAGYRATVVEHEQHPQVRSASQGIGFFLVLGNAAPGAPGRFLDFSFHCRVDLQGELSPAVVEQWNQNRRFARLYCRDRVLVLTMDTLVAGGVSENFLRGQIELWDHVLRDFVRHLQQPAPAAAAARRSAAPAAPPGLQ
ncbi:MAG: YbjN domain-containing protein [Nevskia sp.]|nr:YbjN domain-containing protein [Nevskia sp.]